MLDRQGGGVRKLLAQAERRVRIGADAASGGVEADPPAPPQHAEVELEQPSGVPAGEQDRDAGHHGDDDKRHAEEGEHDEVRDGEEPLHQPLPAG